MLKNSLKVGTFLRKNPQAWVPFFGKITTEHGYGFWAAGSTSTADPNLRTPRPGADSALTPTQSYLPVAFKLRANVWFRRNLVTFLTRWKESHPKFDWIKFLSCFADWRPLSAVSTFSQHVGGQLFSVEHVFASDHESNLSIHILCNRSWSVLVQEQLIWWRLVVCTGHIIILICKISHSCNFWGCLCSGVVWVSGARG